MKSERVTFQNADGHELSAKIDFPDIGEPSTFALFAHCFTCSKNIRAARHISNSLTQNGIAVLRFGQDWSYEGFGRAGELFWVNLQTTCSTGSSLEDSLEVTTWGVAGSPWVFSAMAQDATARDELIVAVVAASE